MKTRVLVVMLALTLGLTMMIPAASAQARAQSSIFIPLNQTLTTANGTVNLTGFNLNSFQVVNGVVSAVGSFVGTATNTTTGAVSNFVTQVAVPLQQQTTASCTILHLVLGPINLDLLGLQVTTNQIVLDISAQPGPGNLLGNLLCSVANLLNGGLNLQPLANLLNQILGAL